jgi:hypothetical protein
MQNARQNHSPQGAQLQGAQATATVTTDNKRKLDKMTKSMSELSVSIAKNHHVKMADSRAVLEEQAWEEASRLSRTWGRQVEVIDVGSGSGGYFRARARLSGQNRNKFRGIGGVHFMSPVTCGDDVVRHSKLPSGSLTTMDLRIAADHPESSTLWTTIMTNPTKVATMMCPSAALLWEVCKSAGMTMDAFARSCDSNEHHKIDANGVNLRRATMCDHMLGTCTCPVWEEAKVYIFTHSFYYVRFEEMGRLMPGDVCFIIAHEFVGDSGHIPSNVPADKAEFIWKRDKAGFINMRSRDQFACGTVYRHKDVTDILAKRKFSFTGIFTVPGTTTRDWKIIGRDQRVSREPPGTRVWVVKNEEEGDYIRALVDQRNRMAQQWSPEMVERYEELLVAGYYRNGEHVYELTLEDREGLQRDIALAKVYNVPRGIAPVRVPRCHLEVESEDIRTVQCHAYGVQEKMVDGCGSLYRFVVSMEDFPATTWSEVFIDEVDVALRKRLNDSALSMALRSPYDATASEKVTKRSSDLAVLAKQYTDGLTFEDIAETYNTAVAQAERIRDEWWDHEKQSLNSNYVARYAHEALDENRAIASVASLAASVPKVGNRLGDALMAVGCATHVARGMLPTKLGGYPE